MQTSVRDTNMSLDDVKKAVLTYLQGQEVGRRRGLAFAANTAKLSKLLGIPPRVLRVALTALTKEKKARYDRSEQGWTLT